MRTIKQYLSAISILLASTAMTGCDSATEQSVTEFKAIDLIVSNVNLITMTEAGVQSSATIAIDDGKIIAIGTSTDFDQYSADVTIDGSGKYMMPGLIDTHVHIFTPFDAPLYPASGVTTVRNMWGFPPHLQMRTAIAAGEMYGPEIITAGRLLDGDPKIWPQSLAPKSKEEAQKIIEEDIAAGYDFVKIYSRVSRERFFQIMEIAKELNVAVDGHIPNKLTFAEAANAGMRSFEHLWGVPGELQPGIEHVEYDPLDRSQWEKLDFDKLDSVIKASKANDVWISPTLQVLENIYLSGDPDFLYSQAKGIEYVSPATVDFWKASANGRPEVDDAAREWTANVITKRGQIVKAMYDAGVNLLIGTDANNPFIVHGFAIYEEMQQFVDAGIPIEGVLNIATLKSAEFLGISDRVGSIEVGKEADLILLDMNPLEAIDNLDSRSGVIVNGRYTSREDLEAILIQNKESAAQFTPQTGR